MSEDTFETGDTNLGDAVPANNESYDSDHGERNEKNVPLNALQAERSNRQRLEEDNSSLREELKMIKDNMYLMMAKQNSTQSQQKEEPPLSRDDVITYGDLEEILSKKERQYQMSIEELKMTQRHPDYQEVVTRYLPDVLKQNPSLRATLEKTQDYELAYHLAKNSDSYKGSHKKAERNADAERIVQNSQRAGSLSSVGQTSPINQAKRYRDMSDGDFQKMAQKNLGYF